MSEQMLSEQMHQEWETQVAQTAAHFVYPPTPDLSQRVVQRLRKPSTSTRRRSLVWATVLLVVLLLGSLAVPPVRAAVLEFLQIGGVRIFLSTTDNGQPTTDDRRPTEDDQPYPTQVYSAPAPRTTRVPSGRAPRTTPTPTPLVLAGETTLAAARAQVDFPIRLPIHPPDLGSPDRVYLQDRNGPLLILIWTGANGPRLALYQLGPGVQIAKGEPPALAETTVDGERAAWVEGHHMLQIEGGQYDVVRLVGDNVLVWTRDEDGQTITYRLETDLPMEEAVRIAESLE